MRLPRVRRTATLERLQGSTWTEVGRFGSIRHADEALDRAVAAGTDAGSLRVTVAPRSPWALALFGLGRRPPPRSSCSCSTLPSADGTAAHFPACSQIAFPQRCRRGTCLPADADVDPDLERHRTAGEQIAVGGGFQPEPVGGLHEREANAIAFRAGQHRHVPERTAAHSHAIADPGLTTSASRSRADWSRHRYAARFTVSPSAMIAQVIEPESPRDAAPAGRTSSNR